MEEEHDQGFQNAPDLNAGSVDIMVDLTHINIRYESLPNSNVLFNTYKINVDSKLLSLFKAFKECDMSSLKDLVPNVHLPVSDTQHLW